VEVSRLSRDSTVPEELEEDDEYTLAGSRSLEAELDEEEVYGESSDSSLIVVAEDDPACMIRGSPVSSPDDALVDVAGLSADSWVTLVVDMNLDSLPELELEELLFEAEDVSFPDEFDEDALVEDPEEK